VFIPLNGSILFRLTPVIVFPGRQEDGKYILKEDDSKMNKEMKKNKKMVLALFIVAALAMVSVAVVAIHSEDSSAAGSGQYIPMGSSDPLIIDGTITADYEFYTDIIVPIVLLPVEITSNANFTGTLTIGTLDKSVTPWDYVPYASMKFTNTSNVNIQAEMVNLNSIFFAFFTLSNPSSDAQVNSDGVYELTDAPSGTFELLHGSVQLGADADNFFNGAVSVAGFKETSEFAYGTMLGISADGTAQIAGNAQAGKMVDPDPLPSGGWAAADFPKPTLSFSGSASIQYPDAFQQIFDSFGGNSIAGLITNGVDVTIEDGALLTVGDRALTLATSVSIEGTDIVYGALFDATNPDAWNSNKSAKATEINATNDVITFYNVPLGTYTLFMIANTDNMYLATVTVASTGISLGSNTLPSALMADDAFASATPDVLTYNAGAYTFISIIKIVTFEAGTATVDNGTSTGSITFEKHKFNNDLILAVMLNRGTGIKEVFFGQVGHNNAGGPLKATTAAKLTSDDEIWGSTVVVYPAFATFAVTSDDVIHIFGTLKLLYVSADQYGSFDISNDAYVNLDVDG